MDEEFIRNRITELRLKKGVSEYQMSMELGQNRSYRVYPGICVNVQLAQNRAKYFVGRKTGLRSSALTAS